MHVTKEKKNYKLKMFLLADNFSRRYHCEITLPDGATAAIATWTRPFTTVAAAFGAVQRHMVVGPRDAARKTRSDVFTQLFNG